MTVVGGDLGKVYKSKEGFGRAAIVGTSDTYSKISAAQAKKAAAKGKPKKSPAEKLMALKKGKGDYWTKDNAELGERFEQNLEYALDIAGKGVDPFTGTDKASQDWQNRMAILEKDMNLSKADKVEYGKVVTKLNAKDANYTPRSQAAVADYYGMTAKERRESGELPPNLIAVEDPLKLEEVYAKAATNLKANNPGYQDADVQGQVDIFFSDPSTGKDMNAVYTQLFQQDADTRAVEELVAAGNSTPSQKEISDKAKEVEAGMNEHATKMGFRNAQHKRAYDDFEVKLGKEDLDQTKIMKAYVPALEATKYSYEDEDGVTRSGNTTAFNKDEVIKASQLALDNEPGLLPQMIRKNPHVTDRATAEKAIQEYIYTQEKSQEGKGVAREKDAANHGYKKKEVEKDAELYSAAVRGFSDKRVIKDKKGNVIREEKFTNFDEIWSTLGLKEQGDYTDRERAIIRKATGGGWLEGAQFGRNEWWANKGEKWGATGNPSRRKLKELRQRFWKGPDHTLENRLGTEDELKSWVKNPSEMPPILKKALADKGKEIEEVKIDSDGFMYIEGEPTEFKDDELNINDPEWKSYEILTGEDLTETVDGVSHKTRKQKRDYYNVTDPNDPKYLDESKIQQMHKGGFNKNKKVFAEIVHKAIEDDRDRLKKVAASGGNQNWKTPKKKKPKLSTK